MVVYTRTDDVIAMRCYFRRLAYLSLSYCALKLFCVVKNFGFESSFQLKPNHDNTDLTPGSAVSLVIALSKPDTRGHDHHGMVVGVLECWSDGVLLEVTLQGSGRTHPAPPCTEEQTLSVSQNLLHAPETVLGDTAWDMLTCHAGGVGLCV